MDKIQNPKLNKGLAFTDEERNILGIRGIFPHAVHNLEQQEQLVLANIRRFKDDLDKYVYLMDLLDKNQTLFYKVLSSNVEEIMPLVYTPTVGEACMKYSFIYNHPKGLFITIKDKGHVYEVLSNWPTDDVKVICVTDGERILGLGDLGAQGMGIPVGKLALYTALAGVNPTQCLPITLDVGTNNEEFLSDPFYIGVREKRTRGQDYDDFVDEFILAVKKRFGETCLIQFEDFANGNAFKFLNKYMTNTCTFNDDIQGTASVALSGLFTASKMIDRKLEENTFLFYGAGEASIGIASLIVLSLIKKGLSEDEARKNIWLVDSKGLIVKDRPDGGINHEKAPFAKPHQPIKDLSEIVDSIKPSVLIGCAAQGRKFTPEILKKMATFNERPIVFALSNPTSKAECTAEEAYTYTEGRAVFASGSPFNKVEFNGKTFYPGQGNNCYIFPAVGLATVACNLKFITEDFFIVAAESLSEQVTEEEMSQGRAYPNLKRIQEASLKIATDVATYAFAHNLSTISPAPTSVNQLIKSQVYEPKYN